MNKQIIIGIMTILAMPLIFGMIAGDTETISFDGEVSECYIFDDFGNLSDYYVDGLNFTESENSVIIYSNILLKPGNLTISCLVKGQREKQSPNNGGGSAAPNGWTAKDGYPKTTTDGGGSTPSIDDNEPNDETNSDIDDEPNLEEEKTSRWLYFWILVGVAVIISIAYKVKKDKNAKDSE